MRRAQPPSTGASPQNVLNLTVARLYKADNLSQGIPQLGHTPSATGYFCTNLGDSVCEGVRVHATFGVPFNGNTGN
jgi:hypothetical protein